MSKIEKHYEIINNHVVQVEKVREKTGIVSEGMDWSDVKIVINNVDAGKSIALMKVALEGKKRKTNIGAITILLITGSIAIFFVLVFMGYSRFTASQRVEVPEVFQSTPEVQNTEPIPIVSTGSISTGEEEKQIERERRQNEIFEQQRQNMQNDFTVESLKIELQKKDIKISELQNENSQILGDKKQLESENMDLKNIVASYEEKKNSREGILLQIGEYIDKVCRVNNTAECKDMYFDILKK